MLAWTNFLLQQEKELGKETVDKWLRSLKVAHFDACNLYLEAKDSIRVAWFEEHIRHKVKSSFFNNNHHSIKVHLTVAEELTFSPSKKTKKKEISLPAPLFLTDPLDPMATLEDFVPGVNNLIPFQLLQELFKNKETLFNPIYLYGAPGVGKSHLLMSLAHAFKTLKGFTVIYVRAETFTEHLVSAIRNGTMREFREAYRNVDILFLDDIHHFARRSASQEELFHTFNTLHTSRRQIILAGLVSPQHLEDIEPRLISRFEWGISLQIVKLSQEEQKLVLQKRLAALQLSLSDEIQHFLIDRFKNTHSLIRALEALILRSKDLSIPLENIELLLKDLIAVEQQSALTPSKIIHAIANYYGITTEDILGKAQTQECVLPRQIAMFFCRQELQLPFQKIGRLFTRDHSTVITSIKAIQKKIESQEPEILNILERFKNSLTQIGSLRDHLSTKTKN